MVTTIGNEDNLHSLLKHLIELDYDAIEAYEAAVERLDNPAFKRSLELFRQDHVAHTRNLGEILRARGETPPDGPTTKRLLTKGKVVLADLAGELRVKDLPEAWNAQMDARLGVKPGNDAEGCLQDVHWAVGSFGYFPSYALGAVIAAQLYETMRAELPELDDQIAAGRFEGLFAWLRQNVHGLAASLSTPELIKQATDKPLTAAAWLRYVEAKYLES